MEFFLLVDTVAHWLDEKLREWNLTPFIRHSSVIGHVRGCG